MRHKRSFAIVDDMMRKIASGELQPGDQLPIEPDFGARYQVSRAGVREAMQVLSAKGFVTIRQGSGTSVAGRESWNVLDAQYLEITGSGPALFGNLLETRDFLEPAVAGLAAERASADQINRLRELADELGAVGNVSPTRHAEVDIAFHATLAEATGNAVLVAMHNSLIQLGREQRVSAAAHQGGVERAVFWHKHIVDAVARRDPEAARDAMRMHIRQVRSEFEDIPREGDQP